MPNRGVAVALAVLVLAAPACTRVSDGVPTAAESSPGSEASEPSQSPTATPAPDDDPLPGVVPDAAPGGPCVPAVLPAVRLAAAIADPSAPTATVGVPDGWSMASDPVGARMEGPDGAWATVSIAVASADADEAFRTYADDLSAEAAISTVSILPAQMCGYSGQRLMGTLSEAPDLPGPVQYEARVVHVPTAGGAYLIAVYVEAPAGAPGFDAAATLLTGDFEITLP